MQNGNASFQPMVIELVKIAKASGASSDDMRKLIDAFVNVDEFIKITRQIETLLLKYKEGSLVPSDFLDAILTILRTDKPLMGAKTEALHNALGVPMIAKVPRPKKAPEVKETPTPKKGRKS